MILLVSLAIADAVADPGAWLGAGMSSVPISHEWGCFDPGRGRWTRADAAVRFAARGTLGEGSLAGRFDASTVRWYGRREIHTPPWHGVQERDTWVSAGGEVSWEVDDWRVAARLSVGGDVARRVEIDPIDGGGSTREVIVHGGPFVYAGGSVTPPFFGSVLEITAGVHTGIGVGDPGTELGLVFGLVAWIPMGGWPASGRASRRPTSLRSRTPSCRGSMSRHAPLRWPSARRRRRLLVTEDAIEAERDGLRCLHWRTFAEELWADRLLA